MAMAMWRILLSGSKGLSRNACSACWIAIALSPRHARVTALKPRASEDEGLKARVVKRIQCCCVIARIEKPDHEAGNSERGGVIAPGGNRQARIAQRCGFFLLDKTTSQVALLVRPGDQRVADSKIRFQFDCLLKVPQLLVGFFGHPFVIKRQGP